MTNAGATGAPDRSGDMDADRKREILNAEARAELIATLVGKGFYVYSPDELERWHRVGRGPGDDAGAPLPGTPSASGKVDSPDPRRPNAAAPTPDPS